MKLFLKRLGTMAGDVWRCCALNAVFEEKSKNHWKEIAIWCPKPSSNILWESLGSLSEGFKDWWVDIVFVHLYHADVWFFSEKKRGHPGRCVKSNQLKKWSNFTWWFWNPIGPNRMGSNHQWKPWIFLTHLGIRWFVCQDLLQLLDGSNRWRQHTEVWKDFLMNMFLANDKESSWWLMCLNSEGGRKLVWGWWDI